MHKMKNYSKKIRTAALLFILVSFINFSYSLKAQICGIYTDVDQFSWGMVSWSLKGNVKQRDRTTWELLPNVTNLEKGKLVSKNSIYFNEKGKQTLDTLIKTGASSIRTTYIYDSSGNVTDMSSYHLDGKLVYRLTYKYNKVNRVTEEYHFIANNKLDYTIIYTYDIKGNLIEKKSIDPKKKYDYRYTYKYDSQNNQTEEWCNYYSNDSLLGRKTFKKYDLKNNLTEEVCYSVVGKIYYRNTYKYNVDSNKTEYVGYFHGDSLIIKETYKYNAAHKLTAQSNYDGKDNLLSTCTRTYDNKNTLTEAISYKKDGSLDSKYELKYTYDTTGNCTSMTTYLDGKPQAITEWVIKYW